MCVHHARGHEVRWDEVGLCILQDASMERLIVMVHINEVPATRTHDVFGTPFAGYPDRAGCPNCHAIAGRSKRYADLYDCPSCSLIFHYANREV